MANVSQLQPALTPQVQTSSSEAPEKDADFLALRLLNKRARLRLSPEPLDLASFPGKACLFAIVNSKGWFAAVTRDANGAFAFILSPLTDLRSALATASADDEQSFKPQRRVPINGAPPHIIIFACNGTRLLLGLVDGSIHVYACDQVLSSGGGPIQPIHVFTTPSSASLLSIHPNPGDIPELVAVLRDCTNSPGSLAVELLDVQKLISSGGWMAGRSPGTTPTSVSWSPKGKQLALGLQSGDIVTFSPTATATPKSSIPHPPSANNMSVISVHWLSTSSFHTIYAPPGPLRPDLEQTHFHVSLDSKSNSVQNIRFNNPYLPFPGLRPPGDFIVCFRGWNPSKVLLFIADGTSSDIGLIGSMANDSGESWHNLSLEETSTPSLPLDKDQNDTVLLGLDVDLTNGESYYHSTASGEALELPAHPMMYVYASDGTILGWHVLNVTGAPHPGMIAAVNASTSAPNVPSVPSSMVRELSSDMQTTPTMSPTTSAPTEASAVTPAPSVFGQSSTPGAQSSVFGTSGPAFGQPTFGQSAFSPQPAPVFGKAPSFGQSSTPAFGSTPASSSFGQSSTSTFASAAPGAGFGAFSSTGPAKFGQPTFGFGGFSQTTPTVPPSISVPEESMAADDAPSFGGLGLGAANSQDADSKPSIFGKASVPSLSGERSTNGSVDKPGTGFGAFGSGFDQKSPFARPSVFSSTQQPTTSFGTNEFQPKPESAPLTSFGGSTSFGTGQSAFGQPAFGQSSFGQLQTGVPAFGKASFAAVSVATPPATSSISTNISGVFSAFASGTQSAFGVVASKSASAKPAWATNDLPKSPEPTSVFGKPTESPESKTPPVILPKTTGTSNTPAFSTASRFMARDSVPGDDDDDSRPSSPAPVQQKDATSLFPSSFTSGPSTGAFSNLQTTPSAFIKPASGSFGGLPKDSPFFTSKPPVSAFPPVATLTTPTSTPPKTSSAQPTFGAPSMPGGAFKNAFMPATTTPTQPPPVSSGGAFSAFSSSGGGFAAFSSGGKKSFSDLLRSTGEEKPAGAAPPEATPKKPDQAPPQPTISTTPASTPVQEMPKQPSTSSVIPKVEGEGPDTVKVKASQAPAGSKEKAAEAIPVQEPSLESISSSTSSSFVKVEEEEGEVVEEETPGEAESHDEESFLSDMPSESDVSEEEESEESSEASDEEEAEEQLPREVEPTEIPLPLTPVSTRSPSTTPKAELPKIAISASPPPQMPPSSSVPRVSPARDPSTTPPESPVKESPSAQVQVPIPPLKASPPSTSPFSLAPRSNNRPIRSSPLASTPLVLEGEAEKAPPISRSAPPVIPAQPAAPKAPFGQWPPPLLVQPAEDESARPNTPPLLSMFPAPGGKPASAVFTPATTPTSLPTLFAPVEKVAATTATPTTLGPSSPLFTLPASFPTFTSSIATPSGWGTPSKPADVAPIATKATPPLFGGQPSLFGVKVGPTTPFSGSPFASPIPSTAPSPSPGPTLQIPKAPTPAPTPEQGMQAECLVLQNTIQRELENLKGLATDASAKVVELKKTSGVSHQKVDLGDPRKWTFGDIEEYGKVLVGVQEDVRDLKLQRISLRKTLKELDSNVLKLTTRKEEITRFSKARTDAEFAKMLKIRTLAPEYSETQSQLRKNIRMIKDRVQKLEDHLQMSKKMINELRTGRPSIRPPSLDTVNRTFRNIDIAIDQQRQEISQLRHRMAKLDLSGGVGTREPLAVSSSKRLLNVTPNVAITAAATLNAERSAQRLKKALLATRTQPLLNTTATTSLLPASLQTPQKSTVEKPNVKTPEGLFTLPTTPLMSFPPSLPGWSPSPLSQFGSPVSHDISPSRNRGATKHHQKPIVLKKNVSPVATPPPSVSPALFEWKPVGPVKPASSLPFALRPG